MTAITLLLLVRQTVPCPRSGGYEPTTLAIYTVNQPMRSRLELRAHDSGIGRNTAVGSKMQRTDAISNPRKSLLDASVP
jgi:hypothetical protein